MGRGNTTGRLDIIRELQGACASSRERLLKGEVELALRVLYALSIKGDQTLPRSPVPRLECTFCLFSLHIDLCCPIHSIYQFFTQSDFCLPKLLKLKIRLLILTFYILSFLGLSESKLEDHIKAGQCVWLSRMALVANYDAWMCPGFLFRSEP